MENKPYRLGITVGRFQTFHNGHQYMIDKAVAQSGDRSFLTHRIEQLREMEEVNRRVIEDYLR